jgi:hypothetical protein
LKKRSHKVNLLPFFDCKLDNPIYLAQVEEWQKQKVSDSNFSQSDCWRWKGKLRGMKDAKSELILLANILHVAESCLDSLHRNAKNENFREDYTEVDGEDIHNIRLSALESDKDLPQQKDLLPQNVLFENNTPQHIASENLRVLTALMSSPQSLSVSHEQ